jgi:hypothetical protein
MRRALLLALPLVLAAPATAAAEDPANQPPFGGEQPPPLTRPGSEKTPPPGFALSTREAVAIAQRAEVVGEERRESADMEAEAFVRGDRWQVSYFVGPPGDRQEVAQVIVDGDSGEVLEAWRDHQVETRLARGYDGAIAQKVNAPYVWLPLCVLFFLPFFDPRSPFRMLHLDLLVLLGLGVSLYFFNRAEIEASVALTYPVLIYFFARMLWVGLRPRRSSGPLIPVVPVAWVAAAALALLAGRAALNVADSQVIDVGLAGVIGADRIAGGDELYEGDFPRVIERGDVYGPANYLAYLPFEQAFPWSGEWDDVPAAHAAAIAFDLLTALGLFALGRRLGGAAGGNALGVALAYGWLAFPFTLYTMNANANDSLVAALTVGAMLALTGPGAAGARAAAGRGVAVALGAGAKFGSAALGPLFATGTGERRERSIVVFGAAFAASGLLLLLPLMPDGGPRELYDRTLGYQASRGSPFSVWGLAPGLDFLQPLARGAAIALALGVAFVPHRRDAIQVAALGTALTVAVQAVATHWFYFYVVWFLPLVLVALFATRPAVGARIEGPGYP